MSNLFSGISGRFRAGGSGKNGGAKSPGLNGSTPTSPTSTFHSTGSSSNLAPRISPLVNSPSLSQTMAMNGSSSSLVASGDPLAIYNLPHPMPMWLNDVNAKHIVKGNFMTLSARPKTVEQGEWLAHQAVEHYRNLWNFVRVVHDKEEDGTSVCNSQTCPRMSAGSNHSFTWLNARKEPTEVPAHEYITLMQRWVSGKLDNPAIFPTDANGVSFAYNTAAPGIAPGTYASGSLEGPAANTPIPMGPTSLDTSLSVLAGPGDWVGKSSGFPQDFFEVVQAIFRQMFRVYCHLYWAHFHNMYDLSLEKQMNSCFSHFVLTATEIEILNPKEFEPMQPLIDLWAADGTFPKESKAYACANHKAGERLLQLAG